MTRTMSRACDETFYSDRQVSNTEHSRVKIEAVAGTPFGSLNPDIRQPRIGHLSATISNIVVECPRFGVQELCGSLGADFPPVLADLRYDSRWNTLGTAELTFDFFNEAILGQSREAAMQLIAVGRA